MLQRCAIPHSFCLANSSDGRTLAEAGTDARLPVILLPDGTVLTDPSNAELASAAGLPISPQRMDFDLVIVGAGPAGLSAAVYGASEGFSTGRGLRRARRPGHLQLLIRNYLGFLKRRERTPPRPERTSRHGPRRHFAFMAQKATAWGRAMSWRSPCRERRRRRSRSAVPGDGCQLSAACIPALEELNGAGVPYGGPTSRRRGWPAVTSTSSAAPIRRPGRAASRPLRRPSRSSCARSRSTPGCRTTWSRRWRPRRGCTFASGRRIVGGGGDGWLDHPVLRDRADGREETVSADGLFLMIGAHPHTDWLPPEVERDERGFVLTGSDLGGDAWSLDRDPFLLETSMPRSSPPGTCATAPSSAASAVGEGLVAIQLLHRLFGRPSSCTRAVARTNRRSPAAASGVARSSP